MKEMKSERESYKFYLVYSLKVCDSNYYFKLCYIYV